MSNKFRAVNSNTETSRQLFSHELTLIKAEIAEC